MAGKGFLPFIDYTELDVELSYVDLKVDDETVDP